MNKISAVILVKDSERLLESVLKALERLDEVVVLDNGSVDRTLEIARSFSNVSLHFHPFIGFGPMKRLGAKLARNDWILSIDSDEVASKELVDELLSTPLDPQKGYSYDVHNYYQGRRIRGCGWGEDRFLGVYHKRVADFDESEVHEKVVKLEGGRLEEVKLRGYISHHPFAGARDFLQKIQSYSDLYVKQHQARQSSSPLKALGHSLWSFTRSYLLKRGFLDGYAGFLISAYNAQSVFWKYIKLYEANRV